MDGSDRSLRPELPVCCIQRIAHHCLHQPVHRERLQTGITRDQGIGPQRFDGLPEQEGISGHWLKHWSQVLRSLRQDLLGDGIGREVGAQPQEVSRRRILASTRAKDRDQVVATGSG